MRRLTLIALLTLACNSAGPTAPDDWPRVATKHGTVAISPGLDSVLVARYVERGFARARTRTVDPERRVDRFGVDGLTIMEGTWGRYHGQHLIEVRGGDEFSIEHEVQHLLADKNGIVGPCMDYQDHLYDNPFGGCDLDGRFAR